MRAPFTLRSYAKVNLHLRVLGKRDDGFHELCTVFQTISLHDQITFEASETVTLTCSDPGIPKDGRNLIIQAAEMLRGRCSVASGARFHLEKFIPSPGGLGGGSSNAAVTLIGLQRLWGIGLAETDLQRIAAELGSDVPFFLHGGTACGTGRGEIVEPIDDRSAEFMIVVAPDIAVSTARAFAGIGAPSLTNAASNRILRVCRFEAESLDLRQTVLINDFESSVFAAYPEIGEAKKILLDLGAVNALLSGSGSSVFGIFEKEETRQAAMKALDLRSTWRKFAVAAISRSEYREAFRR